MPTGAGGCFSWVFIFALYFTPYALIVGQFRPRPSKMEGRGQYRIKHTMGPGLALSRRVDLLGGAYSPSGTKPRAILIAPGWR